MLNSLTVFLTLIAFIAFGYLSLLRLLTKQYFSPKSKNTLFQKPSVLFENNYLLRNLGSSAFFVSLPATALLLFWGAGPALIWLIIFHFLAESIFHLQYSSQQSDSTIADHLLRSNSAIMATVEQGMIQAFFLLCMAVVVALVATLLDRQPGLLFALLFLLPARGLISHPSAAIPTFARVLGAIGLLALGLAFSDQLGFSVYGDWAPLGTTVPWLVFNMPTLIAAIIVAAVFQLETNRGFKQDLSLLSGIIIVLLIVAMTIKLLWLRPILDAPLNSNHVSNETLPSLIGFSLFIFAGFTAFLVRLLNEEENETQHGSKQFSRLQTGGLLHTIYMSLLVISLASALGIGAWKTHFIDWSMTLNILDYLNLAISSNLNLIYADASSGALLHTVLLAALCFTGFSFLLMCANQLSLEETENETVLSLVVEAKIPQAIGIFIVSAYFIGNGISINTWLLIGILAWVLFSHLIIGMGVERVRSSNSNALFSIITLLVVGAGFLQVLALSINWLLNDHYVYLCLALIILVGSISLWIKDLPALLKASNHTEKSNFL